VGATKMSYVALVTALFLRAAASHGDELGQHVDEWGDAVTISPLPHLRRDWAHPSDFSTETGRAPPTPAPGPSLTELCALRWPQPAHTLTHTTSASDH
jgi:hypothetical protein